jgi:transcriptional regulator with XRE-family HTH domain
VGSSICTKFGINVRKYRNTKGYSQEKLAEITGLHRTYISDVERGTRSISLDNIEKLSNALEIQVYKLFVFENI